MTVSTSSDEDTGLGEETTAAIDAEGAERLTTTIEATGEDAERASPATPLDAEPPTDGLEDGLKSDDGRGEEGPVAPPAAEEAEEAEEDREPPEDGTLNVVLDDLESTKTLKELRQMCVDLYLPSTGKKSELAARLSQMSSNRCHAK